MSNNENLNPDEGFNLTDEVALRIFSAQMIAKLRKKAAHGRGGWQTCSQEVLTKMLREHVEKGDPVDVANFCMMLSALGMSIGPAEQQEAQGPMAKMADLLRQKAADEWASHPSNLANQEPPGAQPVVEGDVVARLTEIAYRDTAVSVTVRAEDLRALLEMKR